VASDNEKLAPTIQLYSAVIAGRKVISCVSMSWRGMNAENCKDHVKSLPILMRETCAIRECHSAQNAKCVQCPLRSAALSRHVQHQPPHPSIHVTAKKCPQHHQQRGIHPQAILPGRPSPGIPCQDRGEGAATSAPGQQPRSLSRHAAVAARKRQQAGGSSG